MTDDKYCLLVCDHNESIKITELKTFKIYHLVLEGEKINYCIYIENDILSESTTEKNFYKHFICN
jgi:heat shock protein HspQ